MTAPALSVSTPFGRHYFNPLKGTQVPSITNIKGKKNIEGLKYWAANQAAEYAADNIPKLNGLTRDEVYRLVKGAPFSKDGPARAASEVGDTVHSWIDGRIKGASPAPAVVQAAPVAARQMWRQFLAFEQHYRPQWVDSEFTVWSDTYGYAGTADWAARIGPRLILGDTKTGKNLYPDMGMQLAALAKADYILEPDGTQRPLPKFDSYALLHVRNTFSRLVPVDHIEESFRMFLALKVVFDFDVKYADQVLVGAPKVTAREAA